MGKFQRMWCTAADVGLKTSKADIFMLHINNDVFVKLLFFNLNAEVKWTLMNLQLSFYFLVLDFFLLN